MTYYSYPPVELISIQHQELKIYFGFLFRAKEEKQNILLEVGKLFLPGSKISDQYRQAKKLILTYVQFVHVIEKPEEHKRILENFLNTFLFQETFFPTTFEIFKIFLKSETTLTEIIFENVISCLKWEKEQEKTKLKLSEEEKKLEGLIDFNAYEKALKAEKELWEGFEEENLTKTQSNEETPFLVKPLKQTEVYPWFDFYLKTSEETGEELFPLFPEAETYLRTQRILPAFISMERGLPETLVCEFWKQEKEVSLLEFIEFTLLCQQFLI